MAFTKKYIQLSIFLLICQASVYAQSEKYLFIKTAPLSLLEPGVSVFALGTEYRNNRIGIHTEYGLQTKEIVFNWNSYLTKVAYHKFRGEVKYYFKSKLYRKVGYLFSDDPKPFISLELFAVPKHYTRENDYYITGGKTYDYETANIKRNLWGVCGKLGFVRQITRSIYYEAFVGIGFRKANVTYEVTNAVESANDRFEEWGRYQERIEGKHLTPHLSAGIKLGYLINLLKEEEN